jgi:hypothetical protein
MRGLGLLLLLSISACRSPATEVVVVVDSDYPVPSGLDELVIEVVEPDGNVSEALGVLSEEAAWPRTLGVVHRGGPLSPVRVTARGLLEGTPVVEQRAIFTFERETSLLLEMRLLLDCEGVECGENETCDRLGCRGEVVTALPPFEGVASRDGGPVVDLDAGATDAAVADAGVADAGVADAGPDGGSDLDPCTALPSICQRGSNVCRCDACLCDVVCGNNCQVECTDTSDCRAEATGSTLVDFLCDASSCELVVTGTGSVDARATNGSEITVDCGMGSTCDVDCESGSRCLVDCQGSGDCQIRTCHDAIVSCPDDVQACGRGCP